MKKDPAMVTTMHSPECAE